MGKESSRNDMKNEVLSNVMAFLREKYQTDVAQVGTSDIMMPGVDKEGEEFYYVVTIKVPRGTRNNNGGYTPYNGYDAAREYEEAQQVKAEERAARAAEKEREAQLKAAKREAKQVKKAIENLEKAVKKGE